MGVALQAAGVELTVAELYGTVQTERGDSYTGVITWDNDEEYSWEMLNGEIDDVEFNVEFGSIERIEKTRDGSLVTLRDGRTFELSDGNDVDHGNRGIRVRADGREIQLDWHEFSSLTLTR